MPATISATFRERLQNAMVIWLTTVRADGMPQPTPVWFILENGTFLIYSQPTAQKVRNIAHNPRVALNLNTDEWGSEYVVIMGEARIDKDQPSANQVPAYLKKYRQGITDINMTPESMAQSYSVAIRIVPTHVRGE